MNISNELAQVKHCITLKDIDNFCKEHNFQLTNAVIQLNKPPKVEGYYTDENVIVSFKVEPRY